MPLPFTSYRMQETDVNPGSRILLELDEIEMDFATNPSVFDMNLNTTSIVCSLPSTEKYRCSV